MADQVVAALWDLDGTLIDGAVTGFLVRHLVASGRLRRRRLASMAGYNLLYKLNLLTPAGIHRAAADLISGWPVAEAERVMAQVVDAQVRRQVFAEAVERIAWHRARGHVQVVVTGGPEFAARRLADHLGIAHVLASRTAIRDGRISGEFAPDDLCFGAQKVTRVRAFAAAHAVDLARSYAYSDSRSDLPLLREVGFGHAVNPQYLLARHAARSGIPVLRFRSKVDG